MQRLGEAREIAIAFMRFFRMNRFPSIGSALRPKDAQIGLQHEQNLYLWLNRLAQLGFHFYLEFLLPLVTAPDESPCPPEGQPFLEQAGSLPFALAARLFDTSKKSCHLPQRLVFARLKKLINAAELSFITQDCVETAANLIRHFTEDYAGRPRGRLQFQDVNAGLRDHVINLIFQWTEAALLPRRSCPGPWCSPGTLSGRKREYRA